jgi:hypothetical protein
MDDSDCHPLIANKHSAKLCIPTSLSLAILDLIGSEHVPNRPDQDHDH